jgi:glucose/arabinose dehydrogenase/mono/diheme cytochrome c family protein
MKKRILFIPGAVLLLLYFNSCKPGTSSDGSSISTDSATIAAGEASFAQHCGGCHNFKQDGIGPELGGITTAVSAEWIQHFIRDPKKIIESGDDRAGRMIKKYKVAMPSFATLTDEEMNGIIAFLNTHKKPGLHSGKNNGKELSNPIPDSIRLSNLEVGVGLVTQIPPSSDSGKLPLARITKFDFEPHSGNSFILDLRGKLYKLQNNKPLVYMDMAKLIPDFLHEFRLATGFGSFAFHPDFTRNGLLYTAHSETFGSAKADFNYADSIKVALQYVLTEWKTDNPGAPTFSGKGRELFRVNMVTGIHGTQEITFNPLAKPGDEDYGLLYIGVGDGGSVEEGYPFLVHSRDKVWGTILRIDPRGKNSANGQYGIPQSNPFAKSKNALGEIYAYGFRNPHRITWSKSGDMLACNIGQANIESVNLILPGHDYGWPVREGTFVLDPYGDLTKVYPLPANDSIYKITYPVAQYDHDDGLAISGGFEYWGRAIPLLTGKYLFGDIPSGRLFYIDMADVKPGKQALIKEWTISINGTKKTLKELCGGHRVDLHFGRDSQGELYILTKADGKVYKLLSAGLDTNRQLAVGGWQLKTGKRQ